MVFVSIFLILVGLVMVALPQFIWQISEKWKSSDASEPSSLYLVSIRVGGILCALAGLATLFIK